MHEYSVQILLLTIAVIISVGVITVVIHCATDRIIAAIKQPKKDQP